ncbi:MAG: helix-turn-helix domain-containing protein [Gammaproteobacteria bacterium]|nr:helix-turn-helix domain-containing protein [Gammaproteobacteria bacterium]
MGEQSNQSQRLTAKDAAAYLGISLSKLKKERLKGAEPAFIRIGRRVLYDTTDLDNYLSANRQPVTRGGVVCR